MEFLYFLDKISKTDLRAYQDSMTIQVRLVIVIKLNSWTIFVDVLFWISGIMNDVIYDMVNIWHDTVYLLWDNTEMFIR